ncbi:phenylacetate--CoA ligase family protein [Marivibrio halodurans]|uniref:Phenylacetate--CoA ligase family protein n=1 Tax=Marivibrio halodurans TaxID=2039722 RepID=A0A8J7S1H9_9PROT|nr:AMP-binding protein [Marivibrio halodurans]MBP5858545.1 phenylacetate--CoA ligase family protein [Marivibrio halodurans]
MIDWRMSYRDLRNAQRDALGRQLRWVWENSAFYREIWEASPDPGRFEDLPLVEKQDLHKALSNGFLGSNLACAESELAHIHTSSGTSGKPTYFGLTHGDYAAWMRIFARGFQLGGIVKGDRVLHAFAIGRGYAGAIPMVDAMEEMGCLVLPIGAEAGSVRLIDAIHRLHPSVIYASPSMVRRLAQAHMDELGIPASESSVRLILTGGEPGVGDPSSKRQLSEAWGAEVRECGGGTDVSPLMVSECKAHNGLHFVAGDEVLFEIIDPQTGRILDLENGAEGEIVYTHLNRRASPVVRMRHGDVVRVSTERCACGLESPRIWFSGRSDDMLIVRGVKVFPGSVSAAVAQFIPEVNGAFAIRRSKTDAIESVLRLVCEAPPQATATDLKSRLETRTRDVVGVRVECELVPVGTLNSDGEQKAKAILYDN